jgi:hypothetical protein
MTPWLSAFITAVGLAVVLAGVACGIWAYVQTVRQHDTLPVWPWADRQMKRVRDWRPFKRGARQVSGTVTINLGGASMASTGAVGILTVVRADETIEERVERLERRLEQAETRAVEERARAEKASAEISQEIHNQTRRLDDADEQLRQLTKSVAVSTARVQLAGLILVGTGTVIMALPTLGAAL